ncbi:hypothetical protein GCM10017668_64070 [Streptomyces tuirus]|uniref:Uncharacterized protein n=1 Tax=Streptomyces tuirus TaxID=68278 RepID=A0A7G1NSI2_9ACTN|nr:hypothetical protein GCM10017668_64070 [Streptomyces tuirus]
MAAGAAEPVPGVPSMSAVDVTMTATAAMILFLVSVVIGVSLPWGRAPFAAPRCELPLLLPVLITVVMPKAVLIKAASQFPHKQKG